MNKEESLEKINEGLVNNDCLIKILLGFCQANMEDKSDSYISLLHCLEILLKQNQEIRNLMDNMYS